ncbi:nucleoplasmin-2a [Danio aesculapii]|uniref:nucleoplasmin-2a n=1 Tax=Danio aesculapii TaxID=1142201 RepID=UPI0024C0C83C|nr:nucleoplasmin-2a [Danio aesculapii]
MFAEMTSSFDENDSATSCSLSELSSSSSLSDRACVHWGCVLSGSKTTAVFKAENDLLENQFFIKTICLSEDAGDEMHIVAVCDGVGASKPLPIASLRHCMPMISFPGLELIPPVTFKLCSGKGPVFVSAQHITLNPIEMIEQEEEEEEEEDDEDG